MGRRQWRRFLIVTAMVAAMLAMGASMVSAHARLTASDPADKATVTKAPAQVALTFSQETSATKSGGSVTDASGATVSTSFKVDLNARTKATIDLKPNLPNGIYTVKWNSLTEDDNGAVDGTFTFTIQAQAQTTGTGTATTGTAPASGSAAAGTAPAATLAPPAATVAPTTAPTATVAPTATRPATTPAATTAPATLPNTGNTTGTSGAPWAIVILIAAALAIAGGLAFRSRVAHLRR